MKNNLILLAEILIISIFTASLLSSSCNTDPADTNPVIPYLKKVDTLKVSSSEQVINADNKVKVTIPGNVINSTSIITIESVTQTPAGNSTSMGVGKYVYNIKIEGITSLSKPIQIEFDYDPTDIPSGKFAKNYLIGAYHDGTSWSIMPFTIDSVNKKISISTTHLSVYGYIFIKDQNTIWNWMPTNWHEVVSSNVFPLEMVINGSSWVYTISQVKETSENMIIFSQNGYEWKRIATNIPNPTKICIDLGYGWVYVASYNSVKDETQVYKSTDGTTFFTWGTPLKGRGLQILTNRSHWVYVVSLLGAENKFYYNQAGAEWTDFTSKQFKIGTIKQIGFNRSGYLYVAGHSVVGSSTKGSLLLSQDSYTWVDLSDRLTGIKGIDKIAINYSGWVYIYTEKGLYYSIDDYVFELIYPELSDLKFKDLSLTTDDFIFRYSTTEHGYGKVFLVNSNRELIKADDGFSFQKITNPPGYHLAYNCAVNRSGWLYSLFIDTVKNKWSVFYLQNP